MEGFSYIYKKKDFFFKVMRGEIESSKDWKTRVLSS